MIWAIIIGFIVGLLARAIKSGNNQAGFIVTTLLGIGGSLFSTYVGQQLGWYHVGEKAGFLASIVGAVFILFIYQLIKGRA